MGDEKIKKIMRDIKAIRIQGARNVAVAGAKILMMKAEQSGARSSRALLLELREVSKEVMGLRPTEPALRFGQELIILKAASRKDLGADELRKYIVQVCRNYIFETRRVLEKIALYGSRAIVSGDVVMTHCHSHCVIEIFRAAKRQGKDFTVIVTETRPLYQGTITARELVREKVDVVYCIDSASAAVMAKATKVLVGADAITAEGAIVNKIGTYQIAIEAKEYKVPFIVACGTHKYDSRTALGFPEPIEQRAVREVLDPTKIRGAKIINPAFDVTPKEYIHEIITETGVYSPETLVGILEAKARGDGD